MIGPAALLAWSALALAVTLSPGPDTLLVASHSARGGLRAGLAAVAGIAAGGVYYALLVGFGALSVFVAVPALFLAVKIVGAAYLAWIGAQLVWRATTNTVAKYTAPSPLAGQGWVGGAGAKRTEAGGGGGARSLEAAARPFRQAFLTNILNPKVALFYLAALPQFASGPNAPMIGAGLVGIHFLFGVIWLSFIAFAASRARQVSLNKAIVRWLEGAVGVFLVGVAGRLALTQR